LTWAEFKRLQRLAAADTNPWQARGSNIYDDQDVLIAEFKKPDAAALVVELHNGFIPVCNLVIWAVAKWKDAKNVKQVRADED
jgi:hypothetical protein